MNDSNKDKTILVPLTSSLYVPGTLADVKKVVVDIGTGYYVEKVNDCIYTHFWIWIWIWDRCFVYLFSGHKEQCGHP